MSLTQERVDRNETPAKAEEHVAHSYLLAENGGLHQLQGGAIDADVALAALAVSDGGGRLLAAEALHRVNLRHGCRPAGGGRRMGQWASALGHDVRIGSISDNRRSGLCAVKRAADALPIFFPLCAAEDILL